MHLELKHPLLLQRGLQPLLNSIQVLIRRNIVGPASLAARQREVLGHDAVRVHRVDARLLQRLGKLDQLGRAVELAALDQAARPGKDGGDRVGARLAALLVLAVVPRDGAVGGLGLERLAVGGDEDRGHEAQGAEALGDNVGLDVAVVVYVAKSVVESSPPNIYAEAKNWKEKKGGISYS